MSYFVTKLSSLFFFIENIIGDIIFTEKLDYISLKINNIILAFFNLFYTRVANFSTDIILKKYICFTCSN